MSQSIESHKDISQRLQQLLGAEARGGWICFMQTVEKELPFLMQRGRPNKHHIEASIIGEKGCTSWKDYLKTELKWKFATWKNWKKAYQLSKEYSYIKDYGLEVSELLRVSNKSINFPSSYVDYQEYVEKLEQEKSISLSKTKQSLMEENKKLKEHLLLLQKKNIELSSELIGYTKVQNNATSQVKDLSKTLPIKSYPIADYWLAEVIRTLRLEYEIVVKKFHEKSQEASTLRREKAEVITRCELIKQRLSKTLAIPTADIERYIESECIGISG